MGIKREKWLLVAVLLAVITAFAMLLREQLGLDLWHKAWRHEKKLPAISLPLQWQDPNALELTVSEAIARVRRGEPVRSENIEKAMRRLKQLRPGWPYYLLLEQQWRLAQGRLDPQGWLLALQKGAHEPAVVYAAGATLFQNWATFPPAVRSVMLGLLWHSGKRHQPYLINSAFLSSRLFAYCDYGYNTALDVPPDCRKAGWEPLQEPHQTGR